ncbi:ABC transporter ATP-binding protein [Paenibacillus beijingensis]|uniref:Peptide ABC transporter ATP-binding protein n=1 Tax=Paenibacillus beijingensis TaxID=1126833 RepID=A0A0D5NJT7_9BACL|nr:ABC transporter ATP-binding protein [Paenibacillus beijingensis]AJY75390.1 peptide ABC transporter ATP-binding protein [Paenibacillus beijingensis]
MALLEVKGLRTHFNTLGGIVNAVNGVSFTVDRGETLGIVGESGCGKSVMSLSLMQLNPVPMTSYPEGEILFDGRNLIEMTESEMRKMRGNDIAMIFQDPMTSMNPVMTVGKQIMESIRFHQKVSKKEAAARALQVLRDVGIANPEKRFHEYPHQYSGGMRQRAMIAMALACNPKVLIADEPTTALDVTIQAQILELIASIQKQYGMAILLITHDLGVVARSADRVMVMYAGEVVEEGRTEEVFSRPLMPYTWLLLRSLPRMDDDGADRLQSISGSPPSLLNPPEGCSFYSRCPFAMEICGQIKPALVEKMSAHRAACHLSFEEMEQNAPMEERDEVISP